MDMVANSTNYKGNPAQLLYNPTNVLEYTGKVFVAHNYAGTLHVEDYMKVNLY